MTQTQTLTVRPLQPTDEPQWRVLWRAYLTFYETSVDDAVYISTFGRLLGNAPYDPNCIVAADGKKLVGIVHYLFHRHCWRIENTCYLQDLYADPAVRGTGVGRKLIQSVYDAADAAGCPTVYWTTQTHNTAARQLYDRIGTPTAFMKYTRS